MRTGMFILALLLLAGCASPLASAPTPTPAIVRETVVVRETVIVKETAVVRETVIVTATPRPTAVQPSATPAPAGGKWQIREETSSFDDSPTVLLLLDAEAEISGPVGSYLPALVLRCQERTTEVLVLVGMQPDVEGISDTATTRLRFDTEEAQTLQAGKSTDGHTLFLDPAGALIESMLRADKLVFEFTPFSAVPAEMTFDLRGLGNVIEPLRAACP
jgi:type VI secretion system protein VasI